MVDAELIEKAKVHFAKIVIEQLERIERMKASEEWTDYSKLKTILVTRNPIEPSEDQEAFAETIQVRSFSSQRMAQLRSAILVALTRGVIGFTDRVCCIGGMTGSNQFDTLIVVDIEREFADKLGQAEAHYLLPEVRKTGG